MSDAKDNRFYREPQPSSNPMSMHLRDPNADSPVEVLCGTPATWPCVTQEVPAVTCKTCLRLLAERSAHEPRARTVEQAYELGWRAASDWAKRGDLISDIDSPAYLEDRRSALGAPTPPPGDDAARNALRNCLLLAMRQLHAHKNHEYWKAIVRFCEEGGVAPSVLRSTETKGTEL